MKQTDVLQVAKVAGGMVLFVILMTLSDELKSVWLRALMSGFACVSAYFVFRFMISIYKNSKRKN